MNYSLSDFELGIEESKLRGLYDHYQHRELGETLRFLKDDQSKQRSYLKEMKFYYGRYSHCKTSYIESVLARLVVIRNGIYCVEDLNLALEKLTVKYRLSPAHYCPYKVKPRIPDLTPIPTHEAVKCACCGNLFLEPIIKPELRRRFALCSSECEKVMRLHSRMIDIYRYYSATKSKTVSSRYKSNVRKGKLPLLCFVDYLSSQQRRKANKQNKGHFTWG